MQKLMPKMVFGILVLCAGFWLQRLHVLVLQTYSLSSNSFHLLALQVQLNLALTFTSWSCNYIKSKKNYVMNNVSTEENLSKRKTLDKYHISKF